MDYHKHLRKDDFNNLTNADLKKLEKEMEELKEFTGDKREWISNNIELLQDNQIANNIISEKVLAGQTTIKLFKIKLINSNEETIKNLESNIFNFNKISIDDSDESTSIYSTLKIKENTYLIRLRCYLGVKKYRGAEFTDTRFIDVVYHIDKNIVEVRSDYKMALKIIKFLEVNLHFTSEEIKILSKHKDIELFAKSINGTFKKISSNTAVDISELTKEDSVALGELVVALDNYLIDKDEITFLENIKSISFANDNLTFTYAFLAGCKQIGISVSNDNDMDVLNQGVYKVFNKYLSSDNGYILIKKGNEEYTIKVSTKSNTVRFVSSVSEDIISLVIDNIINDNNRESLSKDNMDKLSEEIQEFINGDLIESFRPERLVERFSLNESTVKGIVNKYIEEGIISEKIEIISPDTGIVVKEFDNVEEIKENKDLIFDTYKIKLEDLNGDITDLLYGEISEYAFLKYSINKTKIKEIAERKEIIKENITQVLVDELNSNDDIFTKDKENLIQKLKNRTWFNKSKAS
ncbi:MAG: hypothetical protein ACRCYC_06515 [Paraclostridium sp.]|uniref:hypothetical protein n=1 Tax=Paraclostridium sp. TaxID=2023273 RepID=UPI003F398D61